MRKKDAKKLAGVYRHCIDSLQLETRTKHYQNKMINKLTVLCNQYELKQRNIAIV